MAESFKTFNPATGVQINEFTYISNSELENKLASSAIAYSDWKTRSVKKRTDFLKKAAEVLEKNKSKYAQMMTVEMGKPCLQSEAEIEKCAWVCRYYAENAVEFMRDSEIKSDFSKSYVTYKALGTILAIMPWNFPFWQVFRFAAPNLAAGNTAVLKHSSNTAGSAIMLEEVFTEAGFPPNVFQNLIISNEDTSKVIADDRIAGVTFTGSNRVGSIIAEQAGKYLKKTVLELGGSDAYIVLEDADIDKAAEICVTGRMINSGQSCIAAKRFIVDAAVVKEFTEKVVENMKKYELGDPMSCSVNLGPMAREDLRETIDQQVKSSIDKGAELLLGGKSPDRKGYFYEATVLGNVQPGMTCFDEEVFGPVACISTFHTEAEAIELANRSKFGLGSAVFTKDISRGERIAKEHLEAGSSFVNDFVKSDPRLPFGGVKQSGYGRELSLIGMREFMNQKTVCIK